MRFFILLFMLVSFSLCGGVLDSMQNISTRNTTLPLYNGNELQAILFGKDIRRSGELLLVDGPCIDIVRKNADPKFVKTGAAAVYPLNSDIKKIMDFWRERILFSDGVVSSPHTDVNQNIRQAFGKDEIHFRSPAIDIDGVGFHANYRESHCLIKSNVKIVIRNGASDVRVMLNSGKIPKILNLIHATSDQLYIHLKKGEIILTGKVFIRDPKGDIKCYKMVILLDRASGKTKNKNNGGNIQGSSVKSINCFGNIEIDMKENAPDTGDDSGAAIKFFSLNNAKQDLLNDLSVNTFCSKKQPAVKSMNIAGTKINARQMRWDFQKNILQFRNDVKIRDHRLNLDCGDLKIYLAPKNKKSKNTVEKIEASNAVNLIDEDYDVKADRMILYFPADKPINAGPDDVYAFGHVLITSFKRNENKKIISKSTLAADKGSIFRQKNKALFLGNVKVRDEAFHLDSDQLHIFVEKYPAGTVFPPMKKGEAPKRVRLNSEYELKHITAFKNVAIYRKNPDGDEKAYGDRADYFIKNRKITLTGTNKKAPVLYKGENTLATEIGSKVIVDLDEQIASTVGGAELHIKESLNKRK